MAIGIKMVGNNNSIKNCSVLSEGEGIHVEGDFNEVTHTIVYLTDSKIVELVKVLKLPEETPIELVREAIEDVEKSSSVLILEGGRLQAWLYKNGFDLAYWTQLAQSITQVVLQ